MSPEQRQIIEASAYSMEDWDRLCDKLCPTDGLKPARGPQWSDAFKPDRRTIPALSNGQAGGCVVHLPKKVKDRLGI